MARRGSAGPGAGDFGSSDVAERMGIGFPGLADFYWCVSRREWMGWGLLGLLLMVMKWIIPSFPI